VKQKIFFSKKLDFGIKFFEKVLPGKSSKLNTLYWQMITSNVLLILIVRKIIFYMRVKHKIGHFEGFFKGAKMFLTPNPNYPELSDFEAKKFEASLKKEKPCDITYYMFCQHTKFKWQTIRISGTLRFSCTCATISICPKFYCHFIVFDCFYYVCNTIYVENAPRILK
jgi:hypothetical protein